VLVRQNGAVSSSRDVILNYMNTPTATINFHNFNDQPDLPRHKLSRAVLIDRDSYFRLLDLLTPEQHEEFSQLAHDDKYIGYAVTVTDTNF